MHCHTGTTMDIKWTNGKRATEEHTYTKNGSNRLQVQMEKDGDDGQRQSSYRQVVCGLCSVGSNKASLNQLCAKCYGEHISYGDAVVNNLVVPSLAVAITSTPDEQSAMNSNSTVASSSTRQCIL